VSYGSNLPLTAKVAYAEAVSPTTGVPPVRFAGVNLPAEDAQSEHAMPTAI
ncbi:MAG: hypothetical protein QOH91_3213, partial [Mycobacterium sp.]|jgi:hypothetical protein|nr:hypothetical protein [Mycobacterium sp.]